MRKCLALAILLMVFLHSSNSAFALDFGKVVQNVAGQAINAAVNNSSRSHQAPQQQYYQQQPQQYTQPQTTVITTQPDSYSYEEYMARINGTATDEDSESVDASLNATDTAAKPKADDGMIEVNLEADEDGGMFDDIMAEVEDEDSGGSAKGKPSSDADTIEVMATGIGTDSDSALKNALRAAIEQAVGTLVDSATLIQNEDIVDEQILSYSAGFVESHKVIGKPKTADGLVTIKIAAQVKRTKLSEKLQAANIHVKAVDGESLFGEVFTAIEQEQNAAEMVKKKLEGFPENMLEIKMSGKPKYNKETKKIQITVEVALNKSVYKSFTKDLIAFLKTIAAQHQTVNSQPQVRRDDIYFRVIDDARQAITICSQLNDARTNGRWEIFAVSTEIREAIFSAFHRAVFTVEIVDSDGDGIVSGRYDAPVPYAYSIYEQKTGLHIFPVLANSSGGAYPEPGTVIGTWTLNFDVSTDEMKRMRNVICKIEKGR